MTLFPGRGRLAEAGFAIEYKDGKISVANKVDSVHSDGKANELHIKTDAGCRIPLPFKRVRPFSCGLL